VVLLAFFVLACQLWRLQVLEGPANNEAAAANSIRSQVLPAARGVVYDRDGHLLAANAPAFTVSVVEPDLPAERRDQVLGELAQIMAITPDQIEQTIARRRGAASPLDPIPIRTAASRQVAMTIEEHSWQLPGINVTVESARQYPDGDLLGHVLGYLAQPSPEDYEQHYRGDGYAMSDQVGVAGLEATYEAVLRGQKGARWREVDVAGRPLRELGTVAAEPGQNLQLTLDVGLQRVATDVLRRQLPKGSSGVAIIMDPRNGDILALVSEPDFDPNVFSQPDRSDQVARLLSDPNLPLFDRAVSAQYPPGSTFKLAVGIGALQEGVANRNTHIRSEGGLRVPNPYNPALSTWFPDWAVLGDLNFLQGLALSSNVYFATLAGGFQNFQGLGAEKVAQYARMMGYGVATGIDLPGEEAGRVPTPDWKQTNFNEPWFLGDTYNMAIGQGFVLATPLQVANLTNLIANNGNVVRPHLGKAILNQQGAVTQDLTPAPLRHLDLRSDVLSVVREGMLGTLDTTQLRGQMLQNIRVAGKTGTAEYVGPRDSSGNLPTHGWFTAFAPYENPQITITVFVEHGGGPSTAVPLAMEILRSYFGQPSVVR
jgi:penicillin-binding protein 2